MSGWLVLLPVLIPLAGAAICLVSYQSVVLQRATAAAAVLALLASAVALAALVRDQGPQAVAVGDWPAPFGIVMVADLFSALLVVLAGIVGTVVVLYSYSSVGAERERFGYYPLVLVLLAGVCGAFLTGDLFNLYVWFEVMLIASFVLLVLGNERAQVEGAVKYVTLNLVASALFLLATGLLYGLTGTLNMAALSEAMPGVERGLRLPVAMLFMVAFGIKAGAFPLFAWMPASYHTPPAAVSALFAGLLTKVGVYSLVRLFTLVFAEDEATTQVIVATAAGLTMAIGVLGAVAQHEFRRILAFHSVSQVGYMLVGLALFTPMALAATIFFILHHGVVKTSLFLAGGAVERVRSTGELAYLGGLARSRPGLAVLFAVPALSLAGLPPSSGFIAKVAVVRTSFDSESYVLAATALAVGLLTLYSMLKIWNEAFWKSPPAPTDREDETPPRTMMVALASLVSVTLLLTALASPVFDLAQDASAQLIDPAPYVNAVLGVQP